MGVPNELAELWPASHARITELLDKDFGVHFQWMSEIVEETRKQLWGCDDGEESVAVVPATEAEAEVGTPQSGVVARDAKPYLLPRTPSMKRRKRADTEAQLAALNSSLMSSAGGRTRRAASRVATFKMTLASQKMTVPAGKLRRPRSSCVRAERQLVEQVRRGGGRHAAARPPDPADSERWFTDDEGSRNNVPVPAPRTPRSPYVNLPADKPVAVKAIVRAYESMASPAVGRKDAPSVELDVTAREKKVRKRGRRGRGRPPAAASSAESQEDEEVTRPRKRRQTRTKAAAAATRSEAQHELAVMCPPTVRRSPAETASSAESQEEGEGVKSPPIHRHVRPKAIGPPATTEDESSQTSPDRRLTRSKAAPVWNAPSRPATNHERAKEAALRQPTVQSVQSIATSSQVEVEVQSPVDPPNRRQTRAKPIPITQEEPKTSTETKARANAETAAAAISQWSTEADREPADAVSAAAVTESVNIGIVDDAQDEAPMDLDDQPVMLTEPPASVEAAKLQPEQKTPASPRERAQKSPCATAVAAEAEPPSQRGVTPTVCAAAESASPPSPPLMQAVDDTQQRRLTRTKASRLPPPIDTPAPAEPTTDASRRQTRTRAAAAVEQAPVVSAPEPEPSLPIVPNAERRQTRTRAAAAATVPPAVVPGLEPSAAIVTGADRRQTRTRTTAAKLLTSEPELSPPSETSEDRRQTRVRVATVIPEPAHPEPEHSPPVVTGADRGETRSHAVAAKAPASEPETFPPISADEERRRTRIRTVADKVSVSELELAAGTTAHERRQTRPRAAVVADVEDRRMTRTRQAAVAAAANEAKGDDTPDSAPSSAERTEPADSGPSSAERSHPTTDPDMSQESAADLSQDDFFTPQQKPRRLGPTKTARTTPQSRPARAANIVMAPEGGSFIQRAGPPRPTAEEVDERRKLELARKLEREEEVKRKRELLMKKKAEDERQKREERQLRARQVRKQRQQEAREAQLRKQQARDDRIDAATAATAATETKRQQESARKRILMTEKQREVDEKRRQEEEARAARAARTRQQAEEQERQRAEQERQQRQRAREAERAAQEERTNRLREQERIAREHERIAREQERIAREQAALKRPAEREVGKNPPVGHAATVAGAGLNSTFTVDETETTKSGPPAPAPGPAPAPAPGRTPCNPAAPPVTSYDITPDRYELPPQPLKDTDNYDIDDLQSDDSTDDESKPRKVIPAWASGKALRAALVAQTYRSINSDMVFPPDELFPDVRLEKIFKTTRRNFFQRTSSACWDTPPTHKTAARC